MSTSITTNLAYNDSGVFLLAETVPLVNASCTFSSPVPSPPWPLAVGKGFSGQATCLGGQSTGTLSIQSQVVGTASLPLDGGAVNTFVVHSSETLAGTTLAIDETDWYAPSLRLPVRTKVVISGGVTGFSIASATTYALASSRPS